MIYVGVDIAKRRHYAAMHDQLGGVVVAPFSFDNSFQGFSKLLEALRSAEATPSNSIVGMEATGPYWMALHEFLVAHGFNAVVINPIHTDAFRKVRTARLTKTDPIDAGLIAELLRMRTFTSSYRMDEPADSLKQLTRYRTSVVSQCTRLKNQGTSSLDRVFPEYASLFSDPFGPTSRAVLALCPTPQQVLTMDVKELTRTIERASQGRLGRAKAAAIVAAAESSIGVTLSSKTVAIELQLIVEQMGFLDGQLKRLDAMIAALLCESRGRWLATIPGIGTILAAQITGEVGDPYRFACAKKLIAFAGLDATKAQSGERDDHGHMSKRGSSQLRCALMQGAERVRRLDPYFEDYFTAKRAQGAPYFRSLACVARKLTGVVLALMKEGRAYEPCPPAHHLPGHGASLQ